MEIMHSTETTTARLGQIVSAPVTEQMRSTLDAIAAQNRRTRSEIIRFALEEYIERDEAEAKATA